MLVKLLLKCAVLITELSISVSPHSYIAIRSARGLHGGRSHGFIETGSTPLMEQPMRS